MYWLRVSLKMPYALSVIFSLKINPTSVLYNLPYKTLQILRSSDSKIPCLEILTTYLSKNKNNFFKTIILQMTDNFIVFIGYQPPTPLKNTNPSFLPSPPFQAISLFMLVFREPPKSRIFQRTPNILSFSSLIPSYLLIVTKFLGKV